MLQLLTKEDEFGENRSQMVLRFTDSPCEDLKKLGTTGASAVMPGTCESASTPRGKSRRLHRGLRANRKPS